MSLNIDPLFFKLLCEDADLPFAAVDDESKFVWLNGAFERLVGYSILELIGKSWMSITVNEDVGADLASVKSVIDGKIQSYRMEKNYIHKRGHRVPVELTVRRFPIAMHEPLILFRVEACPARATRPELEAVHDELLQEIINLKKRIETNEIIDKDRIKIINGDQWSNGDKSGRDKITNSDTAIRYLIIAVVIFSVVISWLIYDLSVVKSGATPKKPDIQIPIKGLIE